MSTIPKPSLSIVTVCYNAADALVRTLESVANQSYRHIQHLIIDGNSKDHTQQVVKNFPHAEFFSEPDKGIYDAMNKGLKYAKGDYVLFLNAGDTLASGCVIEQIFDAHPIGADIYYGDVLIVDKKGNAVGLRSHNTPHKLPEKLEWKDFRFGMVVSHQAFIVRRALAPSYNLQHPYSADIDWCIRCLKAATHIVNTQLTIACFEQGGFSYQNRLPSLLDRFHILGKHFGYIPTLLGHGYILLRSIRFLLLKGKY